MVCHIRELSVRHLFPPWAIIFTCSYKICEHWLCITVDSLVLAFDPCVSTRDPTTHRPLSYMQSTLLSTDSKNCIAFVFPRVRSSCLPTTGLFRLHCLIRTVQVPSYVSPPHSRMSHKYIFLELLLSYLYGAVFITIPSVIVLHYQLLISVRTTKRLIDGPILFRFVLP